MVSTAYEVIVVCSNCGRTVSRRRVDGGTFVRLAREQDGASYDNDPEAGPDTTAATEEALERPVEALVRYTPICRACQASL